MKLGKRSFSNLPVATDIKAKMNKEITLVLEPDQGKLTAEVSEISNAEMAMLRDALGGSYDVNCGKPPQKVVSEQSSHLIDVSPADHSQSIWLYRIYHNSVVDGPGRRIVIQVAGCSIRCPGCYVPGNAYPPERTISSDLVYRRRNQKKYSRTRWCNDFGR